MRLSVVKSENLCVQNLNDSLFVCKGCSYLNVVDVNHLENTFKKYLLKASFN